MSKIFSFLFMLLLMQIHSGFAQSNSEPDQAQFLLKENQNKAFVLSDNDNAYWIGESHRYNLRSHLGLTYRQQPVFKDLFVFVDGDLLSRDEVTATVTPTSIQRYYPDYQLSERLYLLKERGTLVFEYTADSVHNLIIVPAFFDPRSESDITIEPSGTVQKIIQPAYRTHSDLPLASHLEIVGNGEWYAEDSSLTWQIPASPDLDYPIQWIGESSDTVRVFFSLSGDLAEHNELTANWQAHFSKSNPALPSISTDNPQLNKSIAWCYAHLDNLKMTQNESGLFAGLPGRDYYSARESLFGITGAVLIQGEYDFARLMLRRLAEFQISDRADSGYGKIPSILNLGYPDYSAADAASLFTLAVYEYLRYSGEFVLLRELFPVISRSIEGTLMYRTDSDFLLVHDQAATWMDAVGYDGAGSPRENRAVEIQMMWYRQLKTGARLADELGEADLTARWNDAASRVREAILNTFWQAGEHRLADHLNPDDSMDTSLRPNGLLGLHAAPGLFYPEQLATIVKSVLRGNTYPWGVSSLSQTDQNFIPYLNVPRYDSGNPARYNGMIYPWLTGPLVSQLVQYHRVDLAGELTNYQTDKILSSEYAGGLPEFTDALNTGNWRATSAENPPAQRGAGIYSLGMAEYIRNWHQDYLGIRPDAFENELILAPVLPDGVHQAHTEINFSGNLVNIGYEKSDNGFRFEIQHDGNPFTVKFRLRTGDSLYTLEQSFQLAAIPGPVAFFFDNSRETYTFNGRDIPTVAVPAEYSDSLLADVQLQQADIQPDLEALQPPPYPLMRAADIARSDTSLRAIVDIPDPAGDDYGPAGSYIYPEHAFFADGIFDLTNFRVRTDEEFIYFELDFRELVQPGWHPEYGFQLTYTAIGIHTGDEEVGIWNFSRNSRHTVDAEIPMQYMIYIGGGIRVEDHTGTVIAEYRPKVGDPPLADLTANQIRFAIPMEYIPQPKQWWQYTVIAGGQDDRNGGGVGEFREIRRAVHPWYGGGKEDGDMPNWYDILSFGY